MFSYKFRLFSISLCAVWLVLLVKNVDIPIYFGKDFQFVGFERLLTLGNFIAFLSFIMVMLINDDFYIVNIKNLDASKEFAAIIKRRANEAVNQIAELPFVDNVDGLRDRLEELTFARRLMRAMDNSPVTQLPANTVLDFVRQHQKLRLLLRISGDKFDLTSKRAQSAFISLLNDDFLYSKLTERDYESKAKGPVRE